MAYYKYHIQVGYLKLLIDEILFNVTTSHRFDHDNKKPFVDEEDNIRRIIREAFNVWETDTIMKFTEAKEGDADILISFVHPTHTNIDPFVFGPSTLAHAFQPGTELGGDAHFNEEVDWDFNVKYDSKPEGDKVSFFGVALHELGHSLGEDIFWKHAILSNNIPIQAWDIPVTVKQLCMNFIQEAPQP